MQIAFFSPIWVYAMFLWYKGLAGRLPCTERVRIKQEVKVLCYSNGKNPSVMLLFSQT